MTGGDFYLQREYKLIQVKEDFTVGTHNRLPNCSTGRLPQNYNWKVILNTVPSGQCLSAVPFSSFSLITPEFLIPHNSGYSLNWWLIWS